MKVRCNQCMEVFDEDDIIYENEKEYCPHCNKTGCLMDLLIETEVKMNTVNVIEYNETIQSIYAYEDNEEGNEKAESKFKSLLLKNNSGLSDEDVDNYLEEGIYTDIMGYEVYIVHSE